MDFFKKKMKKKVRTSTGQKEPFSRPEESERAREVRERIQDSKGPFGDYSQKEIDEINEARKKYLREKRRK